MANDLRGINMTPLTCKKVCRINGEKINSDQHIYLIYVPNAYLINKKYIIFFKIKNNIIMFLYSAPTKFKLNYK